MIGSITVEREGRKERVKRIDRKRKIKGEKRERERK